MQSRKALRKAPQHQKPKGKALPGFTSSSLFTAKKPIEGLQRDARSLTSHRNKSQRDRNHRISKKKQKKDTKGPSISSIVFTAVILGANLVQSHRVRPADLCPKDLHAVIAQVQQN